MKYPSFRNLEAAQNTLGRLKEALDVHPDRAEEALTDLADTFGLKVTEEPIGELTPAAAYECAMLWALGRKQVLFPRDPKTPLSELTEGLPEELREQAPKATPEERAAVKNAQIGFARTHTRLAGAVVAAFRAIDNSL